jgi:hypothetical protein
MLTRFSGFAIAAGTTTTAGQSGGDANKGGNGQRQAEGALCIHGFRAFLGERGGEVCGWGAADRGTDAPASALVAVSDRGGSQSHNVAQGSSRPDPVECWCCQIATWLGCLKLVDLP